MRCPEQILVYIEDIFKSYHTQINPQSSRDGPQDGKALSHNTTMFLGLELETLIKLKETSIISSTCSMVLINFFE